MITKVESSLLCKAGNPNQKPLTSQAFDFEFSSHFFPNFFYPSPKASLFVNQSHVGAVALVVQNPNQPLDFKKKYILYIKKYFFISLFYA